jgi:hypothetical protein
MRRKFRPEHTWCEKADLEGDQSFVPGFPGLNREGTRAALTAFEQVKSSGLVRIFRGGEANLVLVE